MGKPYGSEMARLAATYAWPKASLSIISQLPSVRPVRCLSLYLALAGPDGGPDCGYAAPASLRQCRKSNDAA